MKYGKIENGRLVYFSGNNIVVGNERVFNPSEETLAKAGVYPVKEIAEDGTDEVITDEESGKSHIVHFVGVPAAPEEPSEAERKRAELENALRDNAPLLDALERMIAKSGATAADKRMAAERIAMREELTALEAEAEAEPEAEAPAEEETNEPENTDEV